MVGDDCDGCPVPGEKGGRGDEAGRAQLIGQQQDGGVRLCGVGGEVIELVSAEVVGAGLQRGLADEEGVAPAGFGEVGAALGHCACGCVGVVGFGQWVVEQVEVVLGEAKQVGDQGWGSR